MEAAAAVCHTAGSIWPGPSGRLIAWHTPGCLDAATLRIVTVHVQLQWKTHHVSDPQKNKKVEFMPELTLWKNEQLRQLKADMDGMIRDFFRDFGTSVFDEVHGEMVVVDITEDDEKIIISAELPGGDPGNLEVAVSPEALILSGQWEESQESGGQRIQRSRRFSNRIKLPCRIDPDKVEAVCENNKLDITLPKSRSAVFKKITIRQSQK
jgi:HSP20 family protein